MNNYSIHLKKHFSLNLYTPLLQIVFGFFWLSSCTTPSSNVVFTDIGTYNCNCDSLEIPHGRLCKSGLTVRSNNLVDTISHFKWGQPINYRLQNHDNRKVLYTENTYTGQYGYQVGVYQLYSLEEHDFMKKLSYHTVVLYQEESRINKGEYIHYVHSANVKTSLSDSITLAIDRHTRICQEATNVCDTVLIHSEVFTFQF